MVVDLAFVDCDHILNHGTSVGEALPVWSTIAAASSVSGTPGIAHDPATHAPRLYAWSTKDRRLLELSWSAGGGWQAQPGIEGCSKAGVTASSRPVGHASSNASIDLLITGCNVGELTSLDDPGADIVLHRSR